MKLKALMEFLMMFVHIKLKAQTLYRKKDAVAGHNYG